MPFNPDTHHRHSVRLAQYDYAHSGAYFVTICTWQRECLFGEIIAGEMVLNDLGGGCGKGMGKITRIATKCCIG
jgi:hypothetical protein